jgi:hypothetical protein
VIFYLAGWVFRRHFGKLSRCRQTPASGADVARAANSIEDLQRGIQIAFAVPETHVASAIVYLLGDSSATGQFADDFSGMFEPLATSQGWSLCAGLLKIRLELRADKLRQTRNVEGFYKMLHQRPC